MSEILYYIPEENYWFTQYWKTYSEVDFQHLNLPEIEDSSSFIKDNSIFELLFNNNYDSTTGYNYKFEQAYTNTLSPQIQRRLGVLGHTLQTYRTTDATDGLDIYGFDDSSSNYVMLNKLWNYRLGNTISLDDVDYENIDTTISQLIYKYLNLMVNGIYQPLDSTSVVSSNLSILDNFFELYIVNEAHKLIKLWKEFVVSDILEVRPIRIKYTIDDDMIETKQITISDNLPNDTSKISIIKNGDFMEQTTYSIIDDSTSVTLSLDSTGVYGFNLNENDIIIVDYFVNVEV